MKNIWTIMRKEFARVFKDPKLLFRSVILPGLMIFLLYSIFGSAFTSINSSSSTVEKPYIIDTINMPQAVETAFDNIDGFYHEFITIDDTSLEEEKEKVKNKDVQLILVYPIDFMDKVIAGEQSSLEMLYNPAETKSDACYKVAVSVMEAFKEAVQAPIFTVETTSIYDEQKTVASYIAMMLPLLI